MRLISFSCYDKTNNSQNDTLQRYIEFYNVRTNESELIPSYNEGSTKARFPTNYLRKICERCKKDI
ncbi:hypothetical protein EZS27_022306 [termite gut metagenome]|uniref:Uncharacterized protein n=1 Tax=termite gut metagenome TaxID=433724 RepID=A0A5J4R5M2_9ZZZZ